MFNASLSSRCRCSDSSRGQSASVTSNSQPVEWIYHYTPVTYSGPFPPSPVSLGCPGATAQTGVAYNSSLTGAGGVQPYPYSIPSGAFRRHCNSTPHRSHHRHATTAGSSVYPPNWWTRRGWPAHHHTRDHLGRARPGVHQRKHGDVRSGNRGNLSTSRPAESHSHIFTRTARSEPPA